MNRSLIIEPIALILLLIVFSIFMALINPFEGLGGGGYMVGMTCFMPLLPFWIMTSFLFFYLIFGLPFELRPEKNNSSRKYYSKY